MLVDRISQHALLRGGYLVGGGTWSRQGCVPGLGGVPAWGGWGVPARGVYLVRDGGTWSGGVPAQVLPSPHCEQNS